MNKKRFRKRALAVAATAVMVGSMAGCGNANGNRQVMANKRTESATEASVTDVVSAAADAMDDLGAMAEGLVTEATDEAVIEEATETVAEVSEPVSENTDSGDSAPVEAKAEDTSSKSSDSSKNRSSGSNSVSSMNVKSNNSKANASSGSSDSSGSGSGNLVPSTQAPHTHNWKEHTATQQVWVSNMVTVDDYEERTVDNGYYKCDCGATFPCNDAGRSALEEHRKASALEYINSGAIYTGAPDPCGGCLICPNYQVERVKVGSHQEDQGHYETQTYVDYHYCDCGARK